MIHLDTNYLIEVVIPGSREDRRISQLLANGDNINVSVMAWAEFLCGPVSMKELSYAEVLLPNPEVLIAQDAELAGELYNQTGWRRGSLGDCLIAACRMRVEAQLATNNLEDFRRFESYGLRILPG